MVQMALEDLSSRNIVEPDEERKAAMVSNLLVVLCADKGTQPVVNTDSFQGGGSGLSLAARTRLQSLPTTRTIYGRH